MGDLLLAAGDSAGGNLVISALVYVSERAQGFPDSKLSASVLTSGRSNDPMAAAPPAMQHPRAVILISPAMDYTKRGTFWRPRTDAIFKYDFIVPFGDSDCK